jgi:predicted nucleic acid-binding protein
MIVVDASALIDGIDGRPGVIERLAAEDIHAPHLIDVEVASALRRLVATDRLHQQRAVDALHVLEQAEIHRHPHQPLLRIIWSLRDRVSAYDAAYVALAAALQAPLVTTDRKLASIAGLPCAVEVP